MCAATARNQGRELDYPVAIERPADFSPLSFSGSDDPSSGSGNTHHPPWVDSASMAFCGPFEQTKAGYTSSNNEWGAGRFNAEYTESMQWPVCGRSGFKPVPWLHGGRGGALKSDPSANCTPDSTNNKCLWAVADKNKVNNPRILYQPLKANDRETDKGYCAPEQLAFKFNVETGEAEGSNEADKVCCPNGDCTADDDEGLNGQTDTTTDGQEHNYILPTIHSTYDNADGGGGNNGGGGNSGGGGNAGANNGVCCPITDGNGDGDTDDVATGDDIDHRVPIMDYSTGLPDTDNKVCCPTGDGTNRHPNLITYTYDDTNKKANDGVGQAKVCCKPTHVAKAPSSSNTEPEANWDADDYTKDVCCQNPASTDTDGIKKCLNTVCHAELKTCTGAGCASNLGVQTGTQFPLDGTGFSTLTEGTPFTVTAATPATNASWGTKTDAYMGVVCKDVSGNLVPNASFDVKIKRLSPVAWSEAKDATDTTAQYMPYGLDILPIANDDIVEPPATQITQQANYIAFPCFGDRRAETQCSHTSRCGDIKGLLLSNMEGEFEFEFNITVNGASQTKSFEFECTDGNTPTPEAVQTCYAALGGRGDESGQNPGLPLEKYEAKLCDTRSICVNNRATRNARSKCEQDAATDHCRDDQCDPANPCGAQSVARMVGEYMCDCIDKLTCVQNHCNSDNPDPGRPACLKDYCDGNKAGKDHCFQGTQEACGIPPTPPTCLLNNP